MAGFTVVGLLGANGVDYFGIGAGVTRITGHGLLGYAVNFTHVLVFDCLDMAH